MKNPVFCKDEVFFPENCGECVVSCSDFEDYQEEVDTRLNAKENIIAAGQNITVTREADRTVISSTGGGGDLSNYYTKTEVDDLIGDLEGVRIEKVTALPSTGENNVIYLVPKTGGTYDEYLWIESTSSFEKIGDTNIDLSDYYNKTQVDNMMNGKVDKVTGKGLSTNDYTTADMTKLAGIEAGAEKNVQSDWNQTSATADDFIKNKPSVYTKTEVDDLLDDKQGTLTAGSNIQIANGVISATDTTYTAGTNVQISNGTISATDTKYTAGTGISISSSNVISTPAPTTKAQILTMLGYEEINITLKDTSGNTITKTILAKI